MNTRLEAAYSGLAWHSMLLLDPVLTVLKIMILYFLSTSILKEEELIDQTTELIEHDITTVLHSNGVAYQPWSLHEQRSADLWKESPDTNFYRRYLQSKACICSLWLLRSIQEIQQWTGDIPRRWWGRQRWRSMGHYSRSAWTNQPQQQPRCRPQATLLHRAVIKNITTIIIIVVTMKQDGFDEYVRGCHNLNNGKKIAKKTYVRSYSKNW